MNFIKFFVSIFSIAFLIISCGTTKNTAIQYSAPETVLTEEKRFEFSYNFFEGNKYYLAGNMDMALSIFNSCLKLDPKSNAVHYKLASIYIIAKDLGKASYHADQSISNSSNIWYLFLAGTIYSQSNQPDKAIHVFKKLIDIDAKRMDYYLSLADIYLQSNNFDKAIEVYNTVDNNFGKSEVISLQKSKIFLSQNNKKAAIKELNELAEFNNNDSYYIRILADFYIQLKEIDKAILVYNDLLNSNKSDGYANIGLAECYRLKGEYETSFNYLKVAFKSMDLPSDLKVTILYSMLQNAQNNEQLQKEIYSLTLLLHEQYPNNNEVKTVLANFLISEQKFEEARLLLREITLTKKDNYALWEQLILLENQFQDWENMYSELNEALELFPTQTLLHFFKGFACLQLEKPEEALEALSFGFRLTTPQDPLRLDFISYLGEVHYKLGNKDKAYSYFDQYLQIEPTNVGILNNYAYYLSVDNKQLDKAAEMSLKTVLKEDNNSTFLDTYAWVLFQQEKYDQALIYIEKAIANNSDSSSVIIEHYGDILYFNNFKEKALEQWNLALSIEGDNDSLKSKISEKRYID